MQTSFFHLPWSERLHLSEKDKMRPTQPVVEIPMLHDLKRKRVDSLDVTSPHLAHLAVNKKQRLDTEYPQQLPTPSSPHVDVSLFPHIAPRPHDSHAAYYASPASTPIKGSAPPNQHLSAQTLGDAKPARKPQPAETNTSTSTSGGYFEAKSLPTQSSHMANPDTIADPLSGLTPLQQVIENEFNMQILMKHNELRLIEQELAKCQVALEQLRRCELRPFPGSQRPELSVSEGSGPTVQPSAGFSRPSHAAPHGVTDGPYSRHYARWLLNDPQFDPTPLRPVAHSENLADPGRMATRHQGQARKSVVKAPSRNTESLQSIPNYPAVVHSKEKVIFQALRRSTDGQLVKLVCKDCNRYNFSSIQGFLNHCRIAHKMEYKSHDSAAIDCGQLLEEHELASVPLETQTAPPPKPKATPARTASVSIAPNRSGLVHPMNTSAGMPAAPSRAAPKASARPVPSPAPLAPRPSHSAPFKPSAQVPRLSALFATHNIGGDLAQAATNARQKIDLGAEDELLSPQTPDATSPLVQFPGASRMPARPESATGFPRPPSRKGYRQPIQRPRPSPLAPSHDMDLHHSALSSPHDMSSAAVSPHGIDSNPGLVSDHEDDDHASASDGESSSISVAPAHLPRVGRSCEDHMEIDVEEDDELGSHGLIIRRNSMVAAEARGIRGAGSPSRKMAGN